MVLGVDVDRQIEALRVGARESCVAISAPLHGRAHPVAITQVDVVAHVDGLKFDFLGSDDRFSLGFTNKKSKWYIDFELSEGFGTYEGGITGIEWLNDSEVLIKRRVSDSQKDIKYNIRNNEWTLVDIGEDKN